jgi:hypothetical protein
MRAESRYAMRRWIGVVTPGHLKLGWLGNSKVEAPAIITVLLKFHYSAKN